MTGLEFHNYILSNFKRTDKSAEIYLAITDTIADMRLQFLSAKHTEEAYLTIDTLGEYRLPFPSDMGHFVGTINIIDTDTDEWLAALTKISKQRYDELYPDRLLTNIGNKNTGTPRHFAIQGEQIFIGPVPDKIDYQYSINYTTEDFAATTSASTDVPFSTKYRAILRAGVLADLHRGIENYDESTFWKNEYQEGLSKIVSSEYQDKQDTESVQYSGV
jgi:hypothetical protein